MKKMIFAMALAATFAVSAEEVLLKNFSKEISFGAIKYGSVKMEQLANGAKFTIKQAQDPKKKDPTHIQINCVYPSGLKAETSYKVVFTMKADRKCKISAGFIGDKSPWPYYVQRWYTLLPNTARTESIEFTPENATGPIRTPCLFLGEVPVGTVFTITDVKLYEVK